MPCTYDDGGASERLERERLHKVAEEATQVACNAMAVIEELERLDHPRITKKSWDWWKKHKKDDAKRLAEEQARKDAAAKRKAARTSGLSKLTADEKRALGLRD